MKINHPTIETDIGTFRFSAGTDNDDISKASINIFEFQPELPEGMEVDKCIAVLLTLVSRNQLKNLKFSCFWKQDSISGDGCSGEGLDAWEWECNRRLVIVGTEDCDFLFSRLGLGEITRDNYPVSREGNRVNINIEHFPAKRKLSLHFLVASNSLPEEKECSCWFAVDAPHSKLIAACPLMLTSQISTQQAAGLTTFAAV